MIRLENTSKVYGDYTAVQKVSFEVKQGERFVLLGSSGSGKTTTLKMINRLIPHDSGKIYVEGKEIRTLDPVAMRRKIGYVMQHAGLFPHLTILENISLVPKLLKWPTAKINKRAEELIEVFGLPFKRFHGLRPQQLSGGQQQRIGIVRALMADPPIILMDEPFGALDPLTRSALRKEFSRLKELQGKAIILVTHDIQEALELGHRIGIMDKGKLLQVDEPVKFIFNPTSDYVKQFFSGQLYSSSLKEMRLSDLLPFHQKQRSESLPLATLVSGSLPPESLTSESLTSENLAAEISTSESLTSENLAAEISTSESLVQKTSTFYATTGSRVSDLLDHFVSTKTDSINVNITFEGTENYFTISEEQLLKAFLNWKQIKNSHSIERTF